MSNYDASRIMNGTWGEVWEDGLPVVEISAFSFKVGKTFESINKCNQMAEDRKLTSVRLTGSMTLKKVYTRGADDAQAALHGHDIRRILMGKLDDPDAYGAERVAIYGVSYDEQVVMDWASAKAGELTVPFQATDFEYLDKVEVR